MPDRSPTAPRCRVVVVNNFPGPGLGGGEVQMLAVVAGLTSAGHEIEAVVVPGSGFGQRLVELGLRVRETPMGPGSLSAASRAVASAASGGGSTILMGTGYLTNLLVRLARGKASGARVVNLVAVMPGASAVDGGSKLGATARALVSRATAGRVDAHIAVSRAIGDALIAGGAPPARVHVVRNGIDADAFRLAAQADLPRDFDSEHPLIVCVARLEPVKGVEHLVRAMTGVPRGRLVVAGSGSQAARLAEIAVASGVAERVSFLGNVDWSASLLAAADVVVLPSLSEGLPMVALEAGAVGRPVVATAVGGIPEVVVGGVTGILVPPADSPALASALAELLDDPRRAAEMGTAARERIDKEFSVSAMVTGYEKVLADLACHGAAAAKSS